MIRNNLILTLKLEGLVHSVKNFMLATCHATYSRKLNWHEPTSKKFKITCNMSLEIWNLKDYILGSSNRVLDLSIAIVQKGEKFLIIDKN